MAEPLPDILLSQLGELVAAQTGLHFPRARWRDFERALRSAATDFNFADVASFAQWLASASLSRNEIELLASHLTVGETYFFREKKSLEILEEHILSELIRARRGDERCLRIWSAGCCTGEEPYSIAMLLNKLIPDLQAWNITILATDINARFLQKASEGVYNSWSFRETPPWYQERFFKRRADGRFEILPQIKTMVTFAYLNLAEDVYPSLVNNTNAMDLIFCRNVLMYFTPQRAKKVISSLYLSLVDGGWLIVSPSETSHVLFSQFVTVNFPDAILYQKDSHIAQAARESADIPFEAPPLSSMPSFDLAAGTAPQVPSPQYNLDRKVEEQMAQAPQPTPYQAALTLYEQGRYAQAAEKIRELSSQNQLDASAMRLLARIHANQGNLSEALECCRSAIAADKLNAGGHYLLAIILQERGEIEEAVRSLKRALYLDQGFVLAHLALGNLTRRQGSLKESEKHFRNALSGLEAYQAGDFLPESEGLTAGRLEEIIRSMA